MRCYKTLKNHGELWFQVISGGLFPLLILSSWNPVSRTIKSRLFWVSGGWEPHNLLLPPENSTLPSLGVLKHLQWLLEFGRTIEHSLKTSVLRYSYLFVYMKKYSQDLVK